MTPIVYVAKAFRELCGNHATKHVNNVTVRYMYNDQSKILKQGLD